MKNIILKRNGQSSYTIDEVSEDLKKIKKNNLQIQSIFQSL